jgi:hypothetical protein
MAKITRQMLQEKGACESQVRLFQQTFGDSVELTEELAKEYGHLFETQWAAMWFLSYKNAKVYSAAARAARLRYTDVMLPARNTYNVSKTAAWDAFLALQNPTKEDDDKFKAAMRVAENIFNNTGVLANKTYCQTCAIAFVRLYNTQQEVNRAKNVALFGFATFLIVALAAWIGVMLK